jgi:hypothetical protein
MPKQTLVVIVGAIILFGVGIIGALAFTGGNDNSNSHQMPNGQTMTGQMNDQTTTMEGGQTMTGMDMSP